MKGVLLAILMLPLFAFSQSIALLDRKLIAPIQLTDSVSLEQIQDGLFPIYVKDIDSVVKTMEAFKSWIDSGKEMKPDSYTIPAGKSNFFAVVYPSSPQEKYNIVLNTEVTEFKTSMTLVSKTFSPKMAIRNLAIFLDYIRNNMTTVSR